MRSILFFKPYFKRVIWGGNKISQIYEDCPKETLIGEAWLISAFSDKPSICINSSLKNFSLKQIYKKFPKFFNYPKGKYPHLIKIIDANQDLSIQVHPNNEYARLKHNSFGKNEAWYILDCHENQSIIYNTNAKNKIELKNWLQEKNWKKIFQTLTIKKDQLIYVPAGTIHAISNGMLVYEIQQTSDITYRIYDYDRKDYNYQKRQLHIEDALNVIECKKNNADLQKIANGDDEYLINNNFFKLKKIINTNKNTYNFNFYNWLEIVVIAGNGQIDKYQIKKGDAFIVPYQYGTFVLSGDLILLVSIN